MTADALSSARLAEDTLRETLGRIRRQFDAVGRASQLEALVTGDVNAAARELTVIGAETIGCERVNVWLFNEDQTELRCIEAYAATPGTHTRGAVLREPDFRSEFQWLKDARYVDAHDALTDPRTAGYVDGYLRPNRITSMLDAVVRAFGRTVGLLCFEHVDRPHHWEPDEIAFACQLADKIGVVLVTESRRSAEERLRESEAILAEAQAIAHVGNWSLDLRSGELTWSKETDRIFGVDPGGFSPTLDGFLDLVHPDDRTAVRTAFAAAVANHSTYAMDYRVPKRDGSLAYMHARGRSVYDADGKALRMVGTVQDITERHRAEEQIRQAAYQDSLTGLCNRAAFIEQLRRAAERTRHTGQGFAVLFVDLDQFKDVNDILGHPVGDRLLEHVADRLRENVRRTDVVARFGGDEFGVILNDVSEPAEAAAIAKALVDALASSVSIDGNEIQSGASVGIALQTGSCQADVETLLAHADVALYRAKAEGRGTYCVFTDAMAAEVRTRVTLTTELRDAIDAGQLFLLYQPQVEIETGRVTVVEALVRWRHPQRGVLSPDVFIRLAEESGLIRPLTRWVLRESCRQAREWLATPGHESVRLAINLSAAQFRISQEVADDIEAVLRDADFPPERLELELTETVLMRTTLDHAEVMAPLRARGVKLAIDDFGTGYSSLDYLRRFSVDRVKIAHSFVRQIATHNDSAAIVRAIVALARELGMRVTAEGVETERQLELLRRWGCQDAQGYLFGRPLPAGNEAAWRLGAATPSIEGVPPCRYEKNK